MRVSTTLEVIDVAVVKQEEVVVVSEYLKVPPKLEK